jgi:hypothetical protein
MVFLSILVFGGLTMIVNSESTDSVAFFPDGSPFSRIHLSIIPFTTGTGDGVVQGASQTRQCLLVILGKHILQTM